MLVVRGTIRLTDMKIFVSIAADRGGLEKCGTFSLSRPATIIRFNFNCDSTTLEYNVPCAQQTLLSNDGLDTRVQVKRVKGSYAAHQSV